MDRGREYDALKILGSCASCCMFMNAVGKFDQKRVGFVILRKEVRVSQYIFTRILNVECINGNALCFILEPDDKIKLPEIKRRVAVDFICAYVLKSGDNKW